MYYFNYIFTTKRGKYLADLFLSDAHCSTWLYPVRRVWFSFLILFLRVIAEELFGLLSSQPEEVVFTCSPCSQHQPELSNLREELQSQLMDGLEEVLIDLLSSNITQHLIICKAVSCRLWQISR